jgi:class 3 adenylate cyclase
MREQRRLAAIVFADVAGYSRLMDREESGTLASLKALRREIVDPQIAAHGGRIVKASLHRSLVGAGVASLSRRVDARTGLASAPLPAALRSPLRAVACPLRSTPSAHQG